MPIKMKQKGGQFGPVSAKTATPPPKRQDPVAPIVSRSLHFSSAAELEWRRELLEAVEREVLGTPKIAVIVPVLARPHRVRLLVESFVSTTSESDAKLYFVAQSSDHAEVAAIRKVGLEPILVGDIDRSWAKKINRGYEHTSEPWLLLGADDLKFHEGWVDRVRGLLETHAGVIGTNDLGNRMTMQGTHSTHPLVRRLYARICGTADERHKVVHEGYDHNFPDTELGATARARGLYVHRIDCVIEHMHPAWGKGTNDFVYRMGQSKIKLDNGLYVRRGRQFGW